MDRLIDALLDPAAYDHPVARVDMAQTHISWILLTGAYAYKIKKPVNFGFLDFSTLPLRQHYCEEELRLNRRLAPDIYLGVVAITGTMTAPRINGTGPVLEYAVKMRQFPHGCLLSDLLARDTLTPAHMDQLAAVIAGFHATAEVAPSDTPFGTPPAVYHPVQENFQQLLQCSTDPALHQRLKKLARWSANTHQAIAPLLAERKARGFIRACHGDLHLRNIVLLNDVMTPFDCIEFNDNLRWIDVMSEIAFIVMDLDDHRRTDLAARLLDAYLQHTGDYAGLAVLPYYRVYRAMVRAKVAGLRLAQPAHDATERAPLLHELDNYLSLAERYSQPTHPVLIITHGLSGSGKTTVSQAVLEHTGAIRLRSDVERKRLFALAPHARSASGIATGIYTQDASQRTYDKLAGLAACVIKAGYSAIVDAAFLIQHQRQRFHQLAATLGVPFLILHCEADATTLEQRVATRTRDASEATLSVLALQQQTAQALDATEMSYTITVATGTPFSIDGVLARLPTNIPRF